MTLRALRVLAALTALAPAADAAQRPSLAESRSWMCYYGPSVSTRTWRSLSLAVLDPDAFSDASAAGPFKLAYVSAGEANDYRSYWKDISSAPYIVEANSDWRGDHRIDIRAGAWRSILKGKVIPEARAKGYQGVMLDTLDVAEYLESSSPARFAGSVRAAGDFILDLRANDDGMLILINNALPLLERVGDAVDGVVVEDLYTRCQPEPGSCGPTPEDVAVEKERLLKRFHAKTGNPVFVVLYSRIKQQNDRWVRKAVRRSVANGFLPYLATPALDRVGIIAPGGRDASDAGGRIRQ